MPNQTVEVLETRDRRMPLGAGPVLEAYSNGLCEHFAFGAGNGSVWQCDLLIFERPIEHAAVVLLAQPVAWGGGLMTFVEDAAGSVKRQRLAHVSAGNVTWLLSMQPSGPGRPRTVCEVTLEWDRWRKIYRAAEFRSFEAPRIAMFDPEGVAAERANRARLVALLVKPEWIEKAAGLAKDIGDLRQRRSLGGMSLVETSDRINAFALRLLALFEDGAGSPTSGGQAQGVGTPTGRGALLAGGTPSADTLLNLGQHVEYAADLGGVEQSLVQYVHEPHYPWQHLEEAAWRLADANMILRLAAAREVAQAKVRDAA